MSIIGETTEDSLSEKIDYDMPKGSYGLDINMFFDDVYPISFVVIEQTLNKKWSNNLKVQTDNGYCMPSKDVSSSEWSSIHDYKSNLLFYDCKGYKTDGLRLYNYDTSGKDFGIRKIAVFKSMGDFCSYVDNLDLPRDALNPTIKNFEVQVG